MNWSILKDKKSDGVYSAYIANPFGDRPMRMIDTAHPVVVWRKGWLSSKAAETTTLKLYETINDRMYNITESKLLIWRVSDKAEAVPFFRRTKIMGYAKVKQGKLIAGWKAGKQYLHIYQKQNSGIFPIMTILIQVIPLPERLSFHLDACTAPVRRITVPLQHLKMDRYHFGIAGSAPLYVQAKYSHKVSADEQEESKKRLLFFVQSKDPELLSLRCGDKTGTDLILSYSAFSNGLTLIGKQLPQKKNTTAAIKITNLQSGWIKEIPAIVKNTIVGVSPENLQYSTSSKTIGLDLRKSNGIIAANLALCREITQKPKVYVVLAEKKPSPSAFYRDNGKFYCPPHLRKCRFIKAKVKPDNYTLVLSRKKGKAEQNVYIAICYEPNADGILILKADVSSAE